MKRSKNPFFFVAWWRQLSVLLKKQFLLSVRNWKGTVVQILAPAFIVLLLVFFQFLTNIILEQTDPTPTVNPVMNNIPRCIPRNGQACTTVMYSPGGVPWVDALMAQTAENGGLSFADDFEALGNAKNTTSLSALEDDYFALYKHIENNQNMTQAAFFFASAYACQNTSKVPCIPIKPQSEYSVFNARDSAIRSSAQHFSKSTASASASSPQSLPTEFIYMQFYNGTAANSYALETKQALDAAILSLQYQLGTTTNGTGETISPNFTTSTQSFPQAAPRLVGFDVVASDGGVWFYVPPMITFFIILQEIVLEKEERKRSGMQMMGLGNGPFWCAYLITGMVFVSLSTAVLVGTGYACQFDFFTKTALSVVYALFWLFGMSMLAGAFFLSTLISSSKSAQTVGYSFILVGFVFQTVLCSAYGALVDLLYVSQLKKWVYWVRIALSFYPPLNLSKAFYDISVQSSKTLDVYSGTIIQGPGYTFADLFKPRSLENFGIDESIPCTAFAFMWMMIDFGVFIVLTWYFDNVFPGEHGSPKPLWFFLTPKYWGLDKCCSSRKKMDRRRRGPGGGIQNRSNPDYSTLVDDTTDIDSDVDNEEELAVNYFNHLADDGDVRDDLVHRYSGDQVDDFRGPSLAGPAVAIANVSKTYRKYPFISSKKDVHAVKGLSLSLREGEIFALLGHNGAGKTTLINMMTGLFGPSAGAASIYGLDLEGDMGQIREGMGVCPQHDILWDKLTAREHLRLFARLKNFTNSRAIDDEVERILSMVGLIDVGDDLAGSFSGGMKRRLSVGIASIGDPKIIFLDEPTTGMDPVNRRAVWHLIQQLKRDRVIVLTTHSMVEADVLGDRISIMAYGELCCVGNSLHLKNKYGAGYRVTLMVKGDGDDKEGHPALNNLDRGVLIANTQAAVRTIQKRAPSAVLTQCDAGSLAFNIPVRNDFVACMKYLEEEPHGGVDAERAIIKEWAVSHTTLEEVFLTITKKHGFVYEEDDIADAQVVVDLHSETDGVGEDNNDDNNDDHHNNDDNNASGGSIARSTLPPVVPSAQDSTKTMEPNKKKKKPRSHAYQALFLKNLTLQMRQKGTNLCQVFTPVLVMAVLVLLQLVMRAELGDNVDAKFMIPTIPLPLNPSLPSLPYSGPLMDLLPEGVARSHQSAHSLMMGSDSLRTARGGPDDNEELCGGSSSECQGETASSPRGWAHSVRDTLAFLSPSDAPFKYIQRMGAQARVSLMPTFQTEEKPWSFANSPFGQVLRYGLEQTHPSSFQQLNKPMMDRLSPSVVGAFMSPSSPPSSSSNKVIVDVDDVPGDHHPSTTNVSPSFTLDAGESRLDVKDVHDRREREVQRHEYGDCYMFFLFAVEGNDNTTLTTVGTLTDAMKGDDPVGGTGMLSHVMQSKCKLDNDTDMAVPYFTNRVSLEEMEAEVLKDQEKLNKANITKIRGEPIYYLMPDGYVTFYTVEPTTFSINYTITVNDLIMLPYHRRDNFTTLNFNIANTSTNEQLATLNFMPVNGQLMLMDMVQSSFITTSLMDADTASQAAAVAATSDGSSDDDGADAATDVGSEEVPLLLLYGYVQAMPYLGSVDLLAILELFGTFLYPIALTLQLPIYVYIMVMEKEEKLREIMKSAGLRLPVYYVVNYVFNFILYVGVIAFLWAAGVLAEIRFFTQTAPTMLLVFFAGWGLALNGLAFFLASFLNSKRASTVLGYVIALIGTLVAIIITVGIYGGIPGSQPKELPLPFLVYPQFTFTRGVYLLNMACATSYSCYGPVQDLAWGDEMTRILIALYLNALGYLVVGLYLDQVLPRDFGIRKHPLFFLGMKWKSASKISSPSAKSGDDGVDIERRPLVGDGHLNMDNISAVEHEDADCRNERRRVYAGNYSADAPLVTRDLRKIYDGAKKKKKKTKTGEDGGTEEKVALNSLCLVVEKGECFGLLGENGAGKTTTLSILTGIFQPTSGGARVGGFDIATDIEKAHLEMGVCPQFNVLWGSLTVEEHLLFYARLKGVSGSTKKHVSQALKEVGLYTSRKKLSKTLSGGMKRRLSVAISLVANSSVVFLDEPTTGLDPSSRRQLWKIIARAKKDRAIILTTHSMDEAELLCTRIGIMAHGQLRALGTCLHLQNRFGDGVRLSVNYEVEDEAVVLSFIGDHFPSAESSSTFKGTSEFFIPKGKKNTSGAISLSATFMLLEDEGKRNGINDFAISQVGLEDVFQSIVRASQGDGDDDDEGIHQIGMDNEYDNAGNDSINGDNYDHPQLV